MKTITKNTILKQGDNTFAAVEHDGNILWLKNEVEYHLEKLNWCGKPIVAQSSPILESIPVISLDSYVRKLSGQKIEHPDWDYKYDYKQILEQISSINEIEVDGNFNVINFK